MKYDLNIKDVINVYYLKHDDWKREFQRPRVYDAVVLFAEGEIEYYFTGKTITAKAGDLLFLPGNLAYSGKARSKTVAYYVIDFNTLSSTEYAHLGAPCVIRTNDFKSAISDFQNAVNVWSAQSIKTNFIIKSLLYETISQIPLNEENYLPDSRIAKIVVYINENFYKEDLSVKSLCKKFFISESQIRRNIIKATGLSPNEYISSLRLVTAKNLLSYTNKSISQIADECGFSSPYYFSRWFNKNLKIPPTKFRQLTSL